MITAIPLHRAWGAQLLIILAAALLLTACGGRVSTGPEAETDPVDAFPWEAYRAEASEGVEIWRLAADASRLWVFVGRSGPLAAFGHDHVVVARGLEGALRISADDWRATRGELHLPVNRLLVDPVSIRERLTPGLGPAPPPEAVAATRDNLLGPRILDAGAYPRVVVRLRALAGTPSRPLARLELRLRGNSHALELPVRLRREDDGLTVSGLAALRHKALGLEPFTALSGALRVAETLVIDFRLRYRAWPRSPADVP